MVRFGSILSFSCCLLSCAAEWGYYQENGQTKLLGSSFGTLGMNATFDYVVSAFGSLSTRYYC